MTRAVRVVSAAVLVAQLACAGAGSYEPRPSPRIAAVHINGRTYVREGQRYEIGLLGGNGEALVAGNEQATSLMRKHRRKQLWTWSLLGLAIGTEVAGGAMLATSDEYHRGPGMAVTWLALVPLLTSLVIATSARHDLVNAVNIYNDALEGPIAPDAFEDPPPPPGGR
jgi:hypothetical protein